MDMEAGKTLTNEEVVRELLELLKKNAMKEQANDVFEICSYVDGLEKKIDSMTEELTNMQNQIKEMQEDTLVNNAKKALSEAQERLNSRCEHIKSQVLEVKEQVRSTAKGIVEKAKEKGRIGAKPVLARESAQKSPAGPMPITTGRCLNGIVPLCSGA